MVSRAPDQKLGHDRFEVNFKNRNGKNGQIRSLIGELIASLRVK